MAFTLDQQPELDVPALAEHFETAPLEEILTWGWETFGKKAAIGTSFQGSGLVIIDHCRKLGLDVPVFTIDTGLLFPETVELKSRLEDYWDIEIESITPEQTVEQQAETMGPELWKSRPDTCCQMRKVLPLQTKLATLDVWVTGLRRGQSEERQSTKILELYQFDQLRSSYILKLNPMATWAREAIWDYLKEHKIPYNPLHDQGYRSIGCFPCTKAVGDSQNERAGRWEGFEEKTECGIHTFLGQGI